MPVARARQPRADEGRLRGAREVAPLQPLTVASWRLGGPDEETYSHPIDRDALALSDIVSFHAYCPLPRLRSVIEALEAMERPLFCTEWMARLVDSRIGDQLPYFRKRGIGAFQWGLVNGRTQTHLPWPGVGVTPEVARNGDEWFHDILTEEGRPHSAAEMETIRSLLIAAD